LDAACHRSSESVFLKLRPEKLGRETTVIPMQQVQNSQALANLGDAYLQLGRLEEAREILTHARAVSSNDPKLHHSLAELYLKLGMREEAYREQEILRELDPSLADALAKLLVGLPKY
jgi:tetratricopeptide (TPR) repeat protein